MKLPYKILKNYTNTSLSPEKLGDRLIFTSSEVEEYIDWNAKFKNIVVGEVLEVSDIENSSHLHKTKINIGSKVLDIVCGAPNVVKGAKVAVATIGTILKNNGEPFEIKESKIRGHISSGMLCSELELGLGTDHDGILILDSQSIPGTDLVVAMQLDDIVLDLEITPNRADLNSFIGLAREVATFDKKTLDEPALCIFEDFEKILTPFEVEIEDMKACPRYSAIYIENVKITNSPQWLKSALILSGIKPINNIVDTLNFVMLEYGQPLHAFDVDKLKPLNGKINIRVRPAAAKEKFMGLDNQVRTPEKGSILITNLDQVIAIAGIIGNLDSSISEKTTKIIIESANFNGGMIRNTSRKLGLRTEASHRFEKGIDPEMTITAIKRVLHILKQSGLNDLKISHVVDESHIRKERSRIYLSFDKIKQVIGINISSSEIKYILQKLGFQITSFSKSSMEVTPPSWRADVRIPEDVIEELVRIWGFDRVPATLPSGEITAPTKNLEFDLRNQLRQSLLTSGFHETIHVNMVSKRILEIDGYDFKNIIQLPNPLSTELEYLLPSHIPVLLRNIALYNSDAIDIKIAELGHVFSQPRNEKNILTLMWRTGDSFEKIISKAKEDITSIFSNTFHRNINFDYKKSETNQPEVNQSAIINILLGDEGIGYIGVIKEDVIIKNKIRKAKNILVAVIELADITSFINNENLFIEPSNYPSIGRAVSFILNKNIPYAEIESFFNQYLNKDILIQFNLADMYQNKELIDQKSVTINLIYNATDRTLTDDEVNNHLDNLSKKLITKFHATIR